MRSRFLRRWIRSYAAPTFAALIASAPRVSNAQRVLGAGDDATVVRRGTARVGAQVTWSSYNQVFQPGGELETLGAPLSPDSLGIIQIETLRPIENALRVLAQQPTATVTLGPIRTDYRARVARTAFMIDLGLTSRIQLSGRLPYEHTISEVVFEANPRDITAHPANIGLNPALATLASPAAAQNRRLVDSLYRASQELATRLQGCASNPGDRVCADRVRVEALVLEAQRFAAGVARTYGIGADTSLGRLFVPTSNSGLQAAIAGRVASLNTAFKAYIPQLSAWDTPFPAQVPITSSQTQELLGRELEIAPLGVVERSHIGDVEVGAKLLIIDTFGSPERARASSGRGFRFAVGGLVRFGTGQVDRPDDLVDVGTGDGQTDVEASAYADVVLARRFWMSAIARYGVQREDQLPLRIPNVPRNPYLMAYREQQVNRDLGDYLVLEATPRYVYNDYLSLSAQWSYRRKGEDTYAGVFTVQGPDSLPVSLDASLLGVDTEQTQQVVGAGLSFSTLRAYDRGRARLPLEVHFLHTQSLSGSDYAPKGFSSQVQVRFYTRLFGAPLRPR